MYRVAVIAVASDPRGAMDVEGQVQLSIDGIEHAQRCYIVRFYICVLLCNDSVFVCVHASQRAPLRAPQSHENRALQACNPNAAPASRVGAELPTGPTCIPNLVHLNRTTVI